MPRHKKLSAGGSTNMMDFLMNISQIISELVKIFASIGKDIMTCINPDIAQQAVSFEKFKIKIIITLICIGLANYLFPLVVFFLTIAYFIDTFVKLERYLKPVFYGDSLIFQEICGLKKIGSIYISDYMLTLFIMIICILVFVGICFMLLRYMLKIKGDCEFQKKYFTNYVILNGIFLLIFFIIFIIEASVYNAFNSKIGALRDELYKNNINVEFLNTIDSDKQDFEVITQGFKKYIKFQFDELNKKTNLNNAIVDNSHKDVTDTKEHYSFEYEKDENNNTYYSNILNAYIAYYMMQTLKNNAYDASKQIYTVNDYKRFFASPCNLISSISFTSNTLITGNFENHFVPKLDENSIFIQTLLRDCNDRKAAMNYLIGNMVQETKSNMVPISKTVLAPILLVLAFGWMWLLIGAPLWKLYQEIQKINELKQTTTSSPNLFSSFLGKKA